MEEEAEELRRQRGEDTKQEIENKTAEDCTTTTFDMFATDAELPPEVFLSHSSLWMFRIENLVGIFKNDDVSKIPCYKF